MIKQTIEFGKSPATAEPTFFAGIGEGIFDGLVFQSSSQQEAFIAFIKALNANQHGYAVVKIEPDRLLTMTKALTTYIRGFAELKMGENYERVEILRNGGFKMVSTNGSEDINIAELVSYIETKVAEAQLNI